MGQGTSTGALTSDSSVSSTQNGGSGSNRSGIGSVGGACIRQPTAGQGTPSGSPSSEGYIAGNRGQRTGDGKSGGPATLPEGYIVGQPPSENNQPDQLSQATAEQSSDNRALAKRVMPPRPGEWQPHEKPPTIKPEEEKTGQKKNGKPTKSLAATRGRDWALPDASGGSVPITRPIKVECRNDQLIILPEPGQAGGKTIAMGARTEASTQAFISAIWEHMNSWGIAGRGMYWRPVLHFQVTPGGEQHFADLAMLLEGSGLKVVRK